MLLTGRIQSERMGRWEGLPVGLNRPGSEEATLRRHLNKYPLSGIIEFLFQQSGFKKGTTGMTQAIRSAKPSPILAGALLVSLLVIGFPGCSRDNDRSLSSEDLAPNILTDTEQEDGWVLLFNGRDFSGWRGLGRDTIPEGHWKIESGAIKKIPRGEVPLQDDGQPLQGGDLMTTEAFEDFEFAFEWRISRAGNSGIKYNVSEELSVSSPPRYAALGFEFQILDDDEHPDAEVSPTHTAGALYDLIAPEGKVLKPVGEYNRSRIVFRGGHGEHWLNGVRVLEFDLATPEMDEHLARSKYHGIPGFANKRKGHIVLQDHTDMVWFRSLKLRRLDSE